MEFEVGSVLTGKVTSITKFGAFVSFASGKSGLVHISEIANAFVSNISDFLKEGQEVSVKVINIDDSGRINLSIKQAQEPVPHTEKSFQRQPRQQSAQRQSRYSESQPSRQGERQQRSSYDRKTSGRPEPATAESVKSADASFEDKLKRFMQDSDSKISSLYSEKKSSRRRSR